MSIRVLVSSLCLVLAPGLSHALVNAGNPGGNLTAPTGQDGQPEDPGFANVLMIRGGTGVYLGNGWVLTARHVNPKWLMLDGQQVLAADAIDKSYSFKTAELKLFRLKEERDLPVVRIASAPPAPGQEIVMIGGGRASQDHFSFWQVNQTTTPWTWTQMPDQQGANAAGILVVEKQNAISWGTNRISAQMHNGHLGELLITDFSDKPGERTAFEAQAVSYDSGGPIFTRTASGWELVGIMVTVAQLYPGQPGIVQPEGGGPQFIGSGLFGNLTLAVNLVPYREEILKVTGLDDE
ncbi:MAG: hypothetical protein Q7Q73_18960 [Verrucomicrobiota bacterium JB024]|nr:hypothetical protein [Verrucomicrobiota bacterium JB024]